MESRGRFTNYSAKEWKIDKNPRLKISLPVRSLAGVSRDKLATAFNGNYAMYDTSVHLFTRMFTNRIKYRDRSNVSRNCDTFDIEKRHPNKKKIAKISYSFLLLSPTLLSIQRNEFLFRYSYYNKNSSSRLFFSWSREERRDRFFYRNSDEEKRWGWWR